MRGAFLTAIFNLAIAAARFFFFRKRDPEQQAFQAKAEEARVMEAPDRNESRVDAVLMQHAERRD